MPGTDDALPEDPTRDEILSRLDEVLQGEDDDLEIPEEDEEEIEDPWAPVEDDGDDVALPTPAGDDEEAEELWEPVEDGVADDLVLAELEPEGRDDPWGASGATQTPELPGVSRRLVDEGFTLPRARPQPALLPALRTLPWRSTADLESLELPNLLCVADPTATGSRLLVAAWAWADEAAGDLLRFRISDDGPEIEAAPASPHEAVIESVIRLVDLDLRVRLHLEAARDQRGVVLGRDVLAGRFVVDASREDWSEED